MSDNQANLTKANFAAIFDMDGTLIDNTPYHYKAWQALFKEHGLQELSRQFYLTEISGVPIKNTIEKFFGSYINEEEQKEIAKQKQRLYEEAFIPFLQPVNGLETFLSDLKNAGIKIALATSSNMEDVDFIFDAIPIRQYFDAIVIGSMVSEPKPSPQIFLKAAERLNIRPQKCVVFEDSISGLKAGRNAGMKVIGITTAHPAATLTKLADMVIDDYAGISQLKMAALLDTN